MLSRIRARLTYANVVATLALFLALGGVAYAGATIGSDDVIDNSLRSVDVRNDTFTGGGLAAADLRPGSVGSSEASGLTGSDILESSLGQVPSATLGGFGRRSSTNSCDPESTTFITCASVTLDLPTETRVLVLGTIGAFAESGANTGWGDCALATAPGGTVEGTGVRTNMGGFDQETLALSGVTDRLGPGNVVFALDCNQRSDIGGAISYAYGGVTAVAISPD
jgi:hypothetical protein